MSSFNIAFFADAHAGYAYGTKTDATGVNLRVRDGYNAYSAVINDIIAHRDDIDVVSVGGDVFHFSHPDIRTICNVQYGFRELSRAGLVSDILAGNHDATDDRSYPAAVAVLDDPERGIFAHHQPYIKRHLADGVVLHAVSHHGLHADDAPELLPEDGALNIFMAHGAAVDPNNMGLMRCMDSPREQIIGPDIIMSEAFDLRMLGHFHSRVPVGNPGLNTWYAGSTLRRGFSDAEGARGWTLFKIHDNGVIEVEHHDIPQRPQFDLPLIDAASMGASEVTELIIHQLEATREDEKAGEFNPLRAPILRQRVINIPTSTREGLDRFAISQNADHALTWGLELIKPERSEQVSVVDVDSDDSLAYNYDNAPTIGGGNMIDVVESYKGWVPTSATVQSLASDMRDVVTDGASNHLRGAVDA